MSKHVAVLMGGWSSERRVSLWSGAACAKALRDEGFHVTEIDVGRDLADVLGRVKPDVCFNALHGRFGEDGTVQGMLEVMGIPYTHSGVLASSLAMHKERAKVVMAAAGVSVPRGRVVTRAEAAAGHVLEPPYVLKPVDGGSSVGVLIVNEGDDRPPQELARSDWEHGDRLLAENFVAGKELTCAVLNGEPLDVIEILPADGWYDFEAKYAKGGSRHVLPAEISPFVYQEVRRLAVAAHNALGCRGVSRADFRFDDREGGTGELVCLEVNTQPGMTETSLVPELAAYVGMGFGELVRWLVEDASLDR